MPHDPNAVFDQSVLDMIEHHPSGAVPFTPAYRDALGRLYTTHQAYPNADHKDGHVTARSLAKLPSFHAENLTALIEGRIVPEELETNASIFTPLREVIAGRSSAQGRKFAFGGGGPGGAPSRKTRAGGGRA